MAIFQELSFREKSTLASLLAVLFVFGGYFADLLAGAGPHDLTTMLGKSAALVISVIVVQLIFQTLAGMFDVKGAEAAVDERDLLVRGRAVAISHLVLSVGAIVVLSRIVIRGAMDEAAGQADVTLFEVANLLLFFFVLSELVNYGAQLFFYRRGF